MSTGACPGTSLSARGDGSARTFALTTSAWLNQGPAGHDAVVPVRSAAYAG
jgi:hypothetical protein